MGIHFYKRMERIILILLSLLLLSTVSDAIKKKYLDTDMDGINDEEDSEDDNDDGDGIDDDEEDEDSDGIPNKDDSDDDGDGVRDELDDDGKSETPAKTKGKGSSGSGPWGTLVFGYYFGLTQYILKTA